MAVTSGTWEVIVLARLCLMEYLCQTSMTGAKADTHLLYFFDHLLCSGLTSVRWASTQHILNLMALKNQGIWLKISALCRILTFPKKVYQHCISNCNSTRQRCSERVLKLSLHLSSTKKNEAKMSIHKGLEEVFKKIPCSYITKISPGSSSSWTQLVLSSVL